MAAFAARNRSATGVVHMKPFVLTLRISRSQPYRAVPRISNFLWCQTLNDVKQITRERCQESLSHAYYVSGVD